MTILQAAVLGAVQGLTEFLPVSSSGHLVLVPVLLGWPEQPVAFDAGVHLATLAAVLLALRGDVTKLVRESFAPTPYGRLARAIAVATLPGLALGFLIQEVLDLDLRAPLVVAASTAFWAVVLVVADRMAERTAEPERARFGTVLSMGFAQALALIPGTSRSGITITAARFGGLSREAAARLSFLLGIPIILISGALAVLQIVLGKSSVETLPFIVGFLASFFCGLAAIRLLLRFLKRGRLWPFAVYRIALAIAVLWLV